MNQDREKLIERIKKLLAVTEERGATEGEAIQAALMAQKLMAEYDIEEYELGNEEEPIKEAITKRGRRWHELLACVIADNFRCKCYIRSRYDTATSKRRTAYIAFYGYKHDAEAAKIVYERLAAVGHKQAFTYAKEREDELFREGYMNVQRNSLYTDFILAFIGGVKSVLEKQSQALMIVCPPKVNEEYKVRAAFMKNGKPFSMSCQDDEQTKEAGNRAGRDAVMSGRINQTDNSCLLTA